MTVTTVSPWKNRKNIQRELFETQKDQRVVFNRQEISTRVIDIPDLHLPNTRTAIRMMNALANSDDVELFSSLTIQTIIMHRWKHIKSTLYLTKLLPYLI